MDFDHLPKEIFEQILRHLSLDEQFRIERVNKRFQEISKLFISKIKSIDSAQQPYRRLNSLAISKLLNLCSSNLEEIRIGADKIFESKIWLEPFAQFSCPHLVKIDISSIRSDFYVQIMEKNRNLQSLHRYNELSQLIMPENVVYEKLEDLCIHPPTDAAFRSMIGKCPNLKYFTSLQYPEGLSREIFENFFATCPKIEKCRMFSDLSVTSMYDQSIYFWRLNSMRELCWKSLSESIIDDHLEKISMSFTRMENLTLEGVQLTNRGVISLAKLKNLRELHLYWYRRAETSIDLGIQRLISGCEHLESLNLRGHQIMSATLTDLVQHCRELRRLVIRSVIDVTTSEEAVSVLESFSGLVKRNISISILSCYKCYYIGIWSSVNVKTASDELRTDGHVIKIDGGWPHD